MASSVLDVRALDPEPVRRAILRLAHPPLKGILLYRKFRKTPSNLEVSFGPCVAIERSSPRMASPNGILPPRYRDPTRIGYGGMGEIFRAEDSELGRVVAVKVLAERFSRDPSLRQRFTREALAAARLSGDPSTVTIYDVGEWEGRPFIVMEHVDGGSLEDRLSSGPPAPDDALEWLRQAAAALDAAHAKGVVHRDVKPANLLLNGDGALRVADFGIASAAGL